MRFGYYIAAEDMLCGDEEFAKEAKKLFHSLGIEKPQRMDSVSVYVRDGERDKVVRFTLHDLFAYDKPRTVIFDI
jgi:hypothetical protein